MVALVADEAGRARTFRTPDQLKEALDLPSAARPLFVLDAWDHPEMDLRPSEAVDFILAVAALRERRAITTSVTEKKLDGEHPGGDRRAGSAGSHPVAATVCAAGTAMRPGRPAAQ